MTAHIPNYFHKLKRAKERHPASGNKFKCYECADSGWLFTDANTVSACPHCEEGKRHAKSQPGA